MKPIKSRYRTVGEIDREIEDILGEFNEQDQATLIRMLEDFARSGVDGSTSLVELADQMDFRSRPPSIEEFLDDPYYLGSFTNELHVRWRQDLLRVFGAGSETHEWIQTGAIGTGKTTASMVAVAYVACWLTHLRDPHAYFGLMRGSRIVIGLYAVTLDVAEETGYEKLRTFMEHSPYFADKAPFNQKKASDIEFKNFPLRIIVGSKDLHALGRDVFMLFMDEANFYQEGNKKTGAEGMAKRVYDASVRRIETRFTQEGITPGYVILSSSRKTYSSFLEEHLESDSTKEKIESGYTYVSDYSRWQVSPNRFSKAYFYVDRGDEIHDARLIPPDEVTKEVRRRARRNDESRVDRYLRVPIDFRSAFVSDLYGALRDIAGVPTRAMTPYLPDPRVAYACVHQDLKHPFTRWSIPLGIDTLSLEDYFIPDRLFVVKNSRRVPRWNPNAPRIIHVDLSSSGDCTGIACAHIGGITEVERTREDSTTYRTTVPMVIIDWCLQIEPPGDGIGIDYEKIRSFIINLRSQGLPIVRVTMDGYMNHDMRVLLAKQGFDTAHMSTDISTEPYESLRQGMAEHRVAFYEHPVLLRELSELEEDRDEMRIDHPEKGSKDVSDAVCLAFYGCILDERIVPGEGHLLPATSAGGTTTDPGPSEEPPSGFINWAEVNSYM